MMKRIITQWTAALALLVALAIPIGMRGESTTVASFSRSGSSNTTSGGTFTTTFSAKTGYYQDANGDCYMQILNNTAYWTTTPNSISFAAKIGGGSGSHVLTDPVYVALLDANGDVISGTQTEVTSYITTNTGDDYNISIPVTNNVYGVKLSHNKENGFNVRYYSFSLSYEEGSGSQTESHTLTFSADPEEGGTVIVGSSNSGSITLEENATVNITATPAEVGYAFSNWTVSGTGASVGSTTSATTTFTMGTEDATLTANFTAVTIYTVIYHANVTGITDIEVVYNAGDDVTVAANTFSNPGFAFSEWNTQADGDGDPYVAGDIIENIQANIDLYAQWEESSETTATLNIQSYANAHSWSNGVQYLTATVDQVIFTAVGGGNTGKYYTSGQDWRYYQGESATITISVPNGYHLVSITPTYTSSNGGALLNGSATIQSGSTVDVSGTSVTFSVGNSSSATNGQVKFTNIDVTYASEGGTPAPSISASNVNIAYNVTSGSIEYTINNGVDGGILTAATESNWLTLGTVGETVPFTCSANEAATERTATVTLTYAYGDTETVTVTKDVTITQAAAPVIYTTIPALFAAATGDETDVLVTFNNWVVSGVSTTGKNVFVTDNDGNGFVIYSNSDMSSTYSAGDILAGTAVSCTLKKYNGFAELLNVDASDLTITDGGTVTAADIAMADLAGVNTGALVHYDNLTCSIENNKYYLSDGTTTLQVYNALYAFGSTFEAGHVYNITGVYQQYNTNSGDTKEILPRSADDIEEVVSTEPTLTVDDLDKTINVNAAGTITNHDVQAIKVHFADFTTPLTAETIDVEYYLDETGQEVGSYEWISEGDIFISDYGDDYYFAVFFSFAANTGSARTAYLKVYALDGENLIYSDLVTINQEEYVAPVPTITVDPTEVNAPFAGAEGTLTVTYENITEVLAEVYFCNAEGETATYDWITASVNTTTNNVDYLIEENDGEIRTAYLKVYALVNNAQDVYSNLVTITQAEYVVDYATLPFEFDGGRADIEDTNGLTQEGLDSDYASSPKLKFNTTGDWVILKINERPGTLTFDIKGNSFSGSTFTVQTSEDGETYTDLENYTSITGTQSEEFDNLGENVRYIKWVYTEKSSGNVALGNITLAEYVDPVLVPSITVAPAEVNVDAEEHDGTLDLTYENLTITDMGDFAIQYYDVTGAELNGDDEPDWIAVEVAEQDPSEGEGYVVSYIIDENDGEARAAYFKVFVLEDENYVYSNLITVTQAANVVTYSLASEIVSGKHYIITSGTDGSVKAMGSQSTNNRSAVSVTVTDGVIPETEGVYEIVIIGPDVEGYYTLYDVTNEKYLYAAGTGSSNHLKSQNDIDDRARWTITFNDDAAVINSITTETNRTLMRYNSGSNCFSCYGSGQQPIYLFAKDNEPTVSYEKEIASYGNSLNGGYYLIASPVGQVTPTESNEFLTNNYDLYAFDQSEEDEWRNYEAGSFNLISGRGYLYANSGENVTLTFEGYPYVGNGQVMLAYDGNAEFAGWNLVGNPFDKNATLSLPYYSLNEEGTALNTFTGESPVEAMEGVFVKATGAGQSVLFTPANTQANSVSQLNLKVTRNRGVVLDNAIIRFDEGATLGKFQLNQNSTKLYIPQGSKDYAVVRSANEGEMPVSFKAAENGTYTLNVEAKNVEVTYLHLIDNRTGADVDLLANPSYTFEANKGDNASRFRLVFKAGTSIEENASTNSFAYFNGSAWVISNTGDATLQVIDMMGRVLSSEQISGNTAVNINETAGIYMLRLVNGENVMVQKVVVR